MFLIFRQEITTTSISTTKQPFRCRGGLHWASVNDKDWNRINKDVLVESGILPNGNKMYVCRCENCGADEFKNQSFPGWVSTLYNVHLVI